MPKERFDDKAFRKHLTEWVDEVADDGLSRTWEIIIGCLAIHAKVDREPTQSRAQAMREAYREFVMIHDALPGTHAMVGLYDELIHVCPDELIDDGTFEVKIREATALALGIDIDDVDDEWDDEEEWEDEEGDDVTVPTFRVLEGGRK